MPRTGSDKQTHRQVQNQGDDFASGNLVLALQKLTSTDASFFSARLVATACAVLPSSLSIWSA